MRPGGRVLSTLFVTVEGSPDPGRVMTTPVKGELTMYTTTWCGFCRRLKKQLARDGIEMAEIDIERDPAAAEFVEKVNGGNQTVPVVVFPDGTAVTNPTAKEVKARLAAIIPG
jgi:mycoredoxin